MHRSTNPQRFNLPPQFWRLRLLQLAAVDITDWLFPWVAINLLWLLLSLTVVLLPPATASLFDTAQRAYRNEPPSPRRFLSGIRHWFWQSWLWAVANVAVFGGLFLAARAVYPAEIPLAIVSVIAVVLVMLQFFFWPYMVLQAEPHILRALRNSAFTALGDLFYAVIYLALALFILIPSLVVIAPFLFITPVLLALMSTYGLAAWLEQHGILSGEPRNI